MKELDITATAPAWTCSTSDALGRTIREERPGYGGAILVTENTYNAAGQLLATTQTSQANPVNPVILSKTLYSYDALGEAVVTARDIDLDGQIDFAGPDIVSSNATAYVELASAWWRESRRYTFPDTGSAVPLLVSTSRQRLSGLGGAYSADGASGLLVAESVSIDARSNQSTSRTVVDRGTATVYQIDQAPDSTVASLSVTVNGLRQSSRSTHNLTTTYAYDALGRMVSMQDARGGVYSRGYDERGRVAWESDPATNGTWYAYDALGRQVSITNALGHVVETAYDAEDRVIATWGATYPVEYDYDAYGRMTAMRTFRDEEGAGDETRWFYEDATGVLTNKVYADGKGPLYSYTPDGKLATRTWARGSVASYAYDASGRLTGIDYSDSTPDVSFTYDRLGRQLSAIAAGVSTNLYAYSRYGQLTNETVQNLCASAPLRETISRATDALGRSAGFNLGDGYAVEYAYDNYGRFQSVESAQSADTFTYTYLDGTDLVSGMTASTGHAWTRSYEPHRNLLSFVENKYGSVIISRFDYENDEIGRRTAISRSGTAFDAPVRDAYGYNSRSEVTSARRSLASDATQEVRGFSYDYAYDPIGNRTSATEHDHEDSALVSSYTANALNQYSQRTVPGYAGVRGSATNNATVTVNGNAAWRLDDYFYGGDDADNSLAAVMKELDITAVVNPPGTNTPDLVESITGRVYVAQSPEAFTHDDDGNLLSDGRFTYTWDGENRLASIETSDAAASAGAPLVKVTYTYDCHRRRIGKVVSHSENNTWIIAESRSFLYCGWNLIQEITHTQTHTLTNLYTWGLDLSGSFQGAGGVGGLLAVVQNGETYSPAFDGNANITEYVSTDGTLAAHYEYSPFGETVVESGDMADAFTFRFSTKYWEGEAKLYYYGFRYYSPGVGRWLNRDPIGERGGFNLKAFTRNAGICLIDLLGLIDEGEIWNEVVNGDLNPFTLEQTPPPTPPDPTIQSSEECMNAWEMLSVASYNMGDIILAGPALEEVKKAVWAIIVGEYVSPKLDAIECDSGGALTSQSSQDTHWINRRLGPSFLQQIMYGMFDSTNWEGTNPFLTVAKANLRIDLNVTIQTKQQNCCCYYMVSVDYQCDLTDQFDFVPGSNQPWYYNALAAPWEFGYNTIGGASRPHVSASWHENRDWSGMAYCTYLLNPPPEKYQWNGN